MSADFDPDPLFARQLLSAKVPPRLQDSINELVDMAIQRKLPGPVLMHDGRRLAKETREEAADMGNYVPWGVEKGQITAAQGQDIGYHLAAIWEILRGTA